MIRQDIFGFKKCQHENWIVIWAILVRIIHFLNGKVSSKSEGQQGSYNGILLKKSKSYILKFQITD